jgi:type IV pilus assembly protein PilM
MARMFTKPKKAIGLDIGTHSVKAVLMGRQGGRLQIEQAGYALVDRNQFTQDPILAQSEAASIAVQGWPVNQCYVVGALPGQTIVIRYPRFQDMPNDRLAEAVEREAGQNIPYDLSEVFLDWTLLDTLMEGDAVQLKVLLVAAKYEVIDTRVQVAESAGIHYHVLGVDSLALSDAAESCALLSPQETVAMINLGASSTSIHFAKDGVSNFIRDVNWGARELISAVMKSRRIDADQAQHVLANGDDAALPEAIIPDPEPEAEPAKPPQDEFSGDLGGSLLDPFDDELGDLGGAPPSAPAPPPSSAAVSTGTQQSLDQILATPMSRLVNEVRRSFDFYEQQLYERPVDRILLSGGVAHLPFIQQALQEELGIEDVVVADPSVGAVSLSNDRSIQLLRDNAPAYMVAVGLAARGMADL